MCGPVIQLPAAASQPLHRLFPQASVEDGHACALGHRVEGLGFSGLGFIGKLRS